MKYNYLESCRNEPKTATHILLHCQSTRIYNINLTVYNDMVVPLAIVFSEQVILMLEINLEEG